MSAPHDGGMVFTDAEIEALLDRVLRAAGSGLRYYMPSTKQTLAKTMRAIVDEVLIAARQGGAS